MPLAWPCPMLSMLSISQLHRHRYQQLRRRQRRRWAGRLAALVGGLAAGFLVLLLELVVRPAPAGADASVSRPDGPRGGGWCLVAVVASGHQVGAAPVGPATGAIRGGGSPAGCRRRWSG